MGCFGAVPRYALFGGVCYARFLPSLGCLGSLESAGSRGLRLDGDPEDYLWKAFRIGQKRTKLSSSNVQQELFLTPVA